MSLKYALKISVWILRNSSRYPLLKFTYLVALRVIRERAPTIPKFANWPSEHWPNGQFKYPNKNDIFHYCLRNICNMFTSKLIKSPCCRITFKYEGLPRLHSPSNLKHHKFNIIFHDTTNFMRPYPWQLIKIRTKQKYYRGY